MNKEGYVYTTVIFSNFQALEGVMRNIDIASFSHLIYPLLMALISMLILIAADLLLIRIRKIIITGTDDKKSS